MIAASLSQCCICATVTGLNVSAVNSSRAPSKVPSEPAAVHAQHTILKSSAYSLQGAAAKGQHTLAYCKAKNMQKTFNALFSVHSGINTSPKTIFGMYLN